MKKSVKNQVELQPSLNHHFLVILLILTIVLGVFSMIFYFTSPLAVEETASEPAVPQLTAQGLATLEIVTPPNSEVTLP